MLRKLLGGFGLGALIAVALVSGATRVDLAAQSPPPQIIQVTNTSSGIPPFLRWTSTIGEDGSLVAFVLVNEFRRDEGLYVTRIDGTELRKISSDLAVRVWDLPTTFTDKIAFVGCPYWFDCQGSNAGFPGNVYLVGLDGASPTRLTSDGSLIDWTGPWYISPVVSRAGTAVAVAMENAFQNDRLFIIDADTTAKREVILPVSAPQGSLTPLSFSPDGSQLAFVISSAGKTFAINTDGTGFRTLSDHIGKLSGDWTTIAYGTPEGLVVQRLGSPPGPPMAGRGVETISYDGGRICYPGLVAYQTVDVFCMNSDGSDLTNVSNVTAPVSKQTAQFLALTAPSWHLARMPTSSQDATVTTAMRCSRLGSPPPNPRVGRSCTAMRDIPASARSPGQRQTPPLS